MSKAPKIKKVPPQEQLQKLAADITTFEVDLPLLMPRKVWPYVETLARMLLQVSGDSKASRDLVAQFALTCRQEALDKFHHDTLETFALARMLREGTARWHPKHPRLDSITHMAKYPHVPQRLNTDQEANAHSIRDVWLAFGKFLEVAGRGLGGGSSSRASALGPVDVMGEDLWAHHRDVFKPWQEVAARTVVERRTALNNHLSIAAVVFKVLVEDIYPEELDYAFALVAGTALKALKAGLNAYQDPTRLARWGVKPQNVPGAAPKEGHLQPQTAAGGTGTADQATPAVRGKPKRPPGLWAPPTPVLPPDGKVKLAPRRPRQGT